MMNSHPVLGAQIIKPVTRLSRELPIIRHHHEWYNGSGYPDRLIGDEIPTLARILHVADSFEAMTAARPYRMTPLTPEQAIAELRKFAGIQFDPKVVDAFVQTHWAEGVSDPGRTIQARPIPLIAQHANRRRTRGTASGPTGAGPTPAPRPQPGRLALSTRRPPRPGSPAADRRRRARAPARAAGWADDRPSRRHPAAVPAAAVPGGLRPVRDGARARARPRRRRDAARPAARPRLRAAAVHAVAEPLVPGPRPRVRRHRPQRDRDHGQRRLHAGLDRAFEAAGPDRADQLACSTPSCATPDPVPAPARPPRRHHPDPLPAGAERRLDRRHLPDRGPWLLPVRDVLPSPRRPRGDRPAKRRVRRARRGYAGRRPSRPRPAPPARAPIGGARRPPGQPADLEPSTRRSPLERPMIDAAPRAARVSSPGSRTRRPSIAADPRGRGGDGGPGVDASSRRCRRARDRPAPRGSWSPARLPARAGRPVREHPYVRLALNPSFSALWTGQVISLFGDRVNQIALAAFVFEMTDSPSRGRPDLLRRRRSPTCSSPRSPAPTSTAGTRSRSWSCPTSCAPRWCCSCRSRSCSTSGSPTC